MKILLPGFAILLGMLLALFGSANELADPAANPTLQTLAPWREHQTAVEPAAVPAAAPVAVQQTPAQRILERTRNEMDRIEQFSARVRYRVALFDQELIGAGTYFQSGAGQQKKLRFELRLQAQDAVIGAMQVCDGRYVWSNTETFAGPLLTRLDLRRLRQRREQLGVELPEELWAWGGLPKLLKNLETAFQWDQALTGYLEAEKMPAWSIRGMWRGEEYAKLVPQAQPSSEGIMSGFPSQVPGCILLYIRQQDYFPQRIEYRRPPLGAKGNVPVEEWVPCVMIEFTDIVTDRQIEPGIFEFQPGKQQEVVDVTDNVLPLQTKR